MKLIYCPGCHDVVKLARDRRDCECGACGGFYKDDGLNAIYVGPAIPLGFANNTLVKAIENQPDEGKGECFVAFVIPKSCSTFRKVE